MILDTAIYQYQWDLGDNARLLGLEAEHCYTNPGDYLVKLNVIDKLTGIVEFNQAEYMVEVRKVVQPFITAPDTVRINEPFQLHGLESYFDQIKPGEYYWDFGDGNKSVGITARHTFLVPGDYQIKLGMVEEDNGDSETTHKFCTYKPIVVVE
jgi:PKD repeat protein